jgi:cell wall-associated NlpC family hydrolase
MSIEAVAGRVQEIVAMQQRMAGGPAAAVSAPSSAATTANAVQPVAAATGTSFSAALATAQGNASAGGTAAVGTPAAGSSDPRVQAMVNMANSLLGKPYVWGGGHAGFVPNEQSLSGFDCSGFVSAVLHAGGYLSQPSDTTAMPSQSGILHGPGQYVTIYDRAQPGMSGHVIIEINGQFYESGGGSDSRSGGVQGGLAGGIAKIGRPSDAYLATFETVLHPSGL